MHMADALISPVVGGTMWVATAGLAAVSMKKVQQSLDLDEKKIPLMGVMGAFVFAAQMINFSIPGTGSSGHIGGGMLLSILLGPYAGFLTLASTLLIQALFFADGGLLAFGGNVFNLGFYTCFIVFPLVYKRLMKKGFSTRRVFGATVISAVLGLQLGAFSVVLETLLSGKTELPFGTFALLMQPIHLAIGVVEGIVTAAVVTFVWKARPEIVEKTVVSQPLGAVPVKKVVLVLAAAAVLTGGVISWFASSNPDGLEWSMAKAAGEEEVKAPDGLHKILADIQGKTAVLPDYGFKQSGEETGSIEEHGEAAKTAADAGTSVSGLVGGVLTLALAGITGILIRVCKRRKKSADVGSY